MEVCINKVKMIKSTFFNEEFGQDKFDESFRQEINETSNKAVSIINCIFTDINNNGGNYIFIGDKNVSVYLSDNVFSNCQSKNGVICLERCRCVTVTHTCSYKSSSISNYIFYYYNCQEKDLSIFLYSTIVDSNLDSNNITSTYNGIQFEAPRSFSYAMNTIVNCKKTCFSFS